MFDIMEQNRCFNVYQEAHFDLRDQINISSCMHVTPSQEEGGGAYYFVVKCPECESDGLLGGCLRYTSSTRVSLHVISDINPPLGFHRIPHVSSYLDDDDLNHLTCGIQFKEVLRLFESQNSWGQEDAIVIERMCSRLLSTRVLRPLPDK